jgi:hypothetical protein
MQRAIERRLSHLEKLFPARLTYGRFAARVSEHIMRSGVSRGAALVTVLRDLSDGELNGLAEEVRGTVRAEIEEQETIRMGAIKAGFSSEDVELLVRRFGNVSDQ